MHDDTIHMKAREGTTRGGYLLYDALGLVSGAEEQLALTELGLQLNARMNIVISLEPYHTTPHHCMSRHFRLVTAKS